MPSVILVSPEGVEKTIDSTSAFNALVYSQGYKAKVGTLAQAYAALLGDPTVITPSPTRYIRADEVGAVAAADLTLRAASVSAVVESGQVLTTSKVGSYVTVGSPTGGDDTDLIHAARDLAGIGGKLIFTSGTYLTSGLTANKAGQEWDLWPGVTIKAADGSIKSIIDIRANEVTISGTGAAVLDGNRANVSGGAGTAIFTGASTSGVRVRGLTIRDTYGYGVWVRDASRASVSELYVINTRLAGIIFDHSAADGFGNSIRNCTVDRTAEDAAITSAGIQFRGGAGKKNQRGRIEGNTVRMPNQCTNPGNFAICIEVAAGASYCSVVGNTTYQGQMGISIAQVTGAAVTGNTVYAPSSGVAAVNENYGIEVALAPYTTVTGNQIVGQDDVGQPATWNGVGLSQTGSANVVVVGNTIQGTKNAAVNVSGDCPYVTVAGNSIDITQGMAIKIANSTDPTVTGNIIKGVLGGSVQGIYLWSLASPVSNATITGNRVSNCPIGLNVVGAAGTVTDRLTITGNNLAGCTTAIANPTLSGGATIGPNCKVVANQGATGLVENAWAHRLTAGVRYGPQAGSASTAALTANQLVAYPFAVNRWPATSLTEAGIQISALAASSSVRLGVYADNNGQPGNLVADWGTVSGASTGYKTVPIAWNPSPGRYWICAVAQGGTPTVGIVTGVSAYVGKPTADGSGQTIAYISPTSTPAELPSVFGTPADTTFGPRVQMLAA